MTAYEMRISDWSSDVCSSDLTREQHQQSVGIDDLAGAGDHAQTIAIAIEGHAQVGAGLTHREEPVFRSEERRVGKEGVSTCRSRCAPYHSHKKYSHTPCHPIYHHQTHTSKRKYINNT